MRHAYAINKGAQDKMRQSVEREFHYQDIMLARYQYYFKDMSIISNSYSVQREKYKEGKIMNVDNSRDWHDSQAPFA